jgi:hypothetical protein
VGFLKRKLLGMPVWVWGAVLLALAGGYIVYKRRQASAGVAGQTAPEAGTTTGSYVPSTGSATSPDDSGGASSATGAAPDDSDLLTSLLGPDSSLVTDLNQIAANGAAGYAGATGVSPMISPGMITATPGATTGGYTTTTTSPAAPAAAAAPKPVAAPAFGGVKSTKKLANGATLTIYNSGHETEQAPGKSAYVVKK